MRTFTPEFRDELRESRYPFGDTATLTSDDGTQLEATVFADASIYPIGAVLPLYLSQLVVSADLISLEIKDSVRRVRCTTRFSPQSPPDQLHLADDYGRPAGVLVLSEDGATSLSSMVPGTYAFASDATTFAARCVIPTPEVGVRGILTEAGELLTGDVWLVGGDGVVIRRGDTASDIRIDIVGDPLFVRSLCEQVALFSPPRFIQTINGCPPDDHGNYELAVADDLCDDTILRIYPTDAGLKIEAAGAGAIGGTD